MLGTEGKHQGTRSGPQDFMLDILLILCELTAECTGHGIGPVRIFNDLYSAEHNNALNMQRPGITDPVPAVIDAEGSFVMPADRIDLMALLSAVEIKLPVLFILVVIDRHSLGIIIVSQYAENASFFFLQDADAFFRRKLLFEPDHFSEHN